MWCLRLSHKRTAIVTPYDSMIGKRHLTPLWVVEKVGSSPREKGPTRGLGSC